jgi:hypothetical protein
MEPINSLFSVYERLRLKYWHYVPTKSDVARAESSMEVRKASIEVAIVGREARASLHRRADNAIRFMADTRKELVAQRLKRRLAEALR